jgi:hypothetical protein|tara:strand:- start:2861 stop:3079 length:219 start_codon:yes stop_codon:yes gene_type:complete
MYIELREKAGKFYVLLRHEDSKEKAVAHFVSSSKVESYNVAKQYAKQNKCLIRVTDAANLETPELPPTPDYL